MKDFSGMEPIQLYWKQRSRMKKNAAKSDKPPRKKRGHQQKIDLRSGGEVCENDISHVSHKLPNVEMSSPFANFQDSTPEIRHVTSPQMGLELIKFSSDSSQYGARNSTRKKPLPQLE
jgi:hypothetical protein